MTLSADKNAALLPLTGSIIKEHPYLSALILCIAVEVFTLGDQSYIGGQTIFITVSVLAAVLIYTLRSRLKKIPVAIPLIAGVFIAVGAMLTGSVRLGAAVCFAVIISSAAVLLVLIKKKAVTPERLTALVIYLSFGIFTAYTIYTYSTFRQTDVGGWEAYSGHAGYINHFVDNNFLLPDFDPRDRSQFYHPPLYYFTSALLARLVMLFGVEKIQAVEICQVVSLYSAFCIVITSCRIFRHFGLKGYSLTAAAAIVSMCNALAILGGSVSNDAMSTALELGALLCALNWYDSGKASDIVKSALCMGCGMMTKLSAWMAAPAMAFLFIIVFVRSIRSRDFKKTGRVSLQYIVFLIICAPLALWFPVLNNIKYGIPIGYVPMGAYEIGQTNAFIRLFTIGAKAFTSPFVLPQNFSDEYNPFFTLFKSSLDLQRLSKYDSLSALLTLSLIVGITVALVGFISIPASYFIRKKTIKTEKNIAMVLFYLTLIISYTVFCIKYPFIVTQNIRYIYAVVMIGAMYFGKCTAFLCSKEKTGPVFVKIFTGITAVYVFCFAATFGFLGFIQ